MSRILGIDPGTLRCGVAITDSAQTMAFPRPALDAGELFIKKLTELIEEEFVGSIVIGRPISLSGNETQSTEVADQLFEAIKVAFPAFLVVQWDERLTTLEAQKSLSGAGMKAKNHREHIDSAAAVIMLQNYVDALPSA